MKIKIQKIIYFIILALMLSVAVSALASNNRVSTISSISEEKIIEPSDFFKDFPDIELGMSFEAAKKAIESKDIQPVGFKEEKTELIWDAKFNGIMGNGQIRFKENTGVSEISVTMYAMNKRTAVFKSFQQKITARYGAAQEVEDTSEYTSNLWQLKNGVLIGIQVIKDANRPNVSIYWIKR